MENQNSTKATTIALVIIGALVLIFVSIFLYKRKMSQVDLADIIPSTDPLLPVGLPSGWTSPPEPQPTLESPFKNETRGNLFRQWVNDNYPAYAKEIDLDVTGSHTNAYIMRAWEKYGVEYMKAHQTGDAEQVTTVDQNKKNYSDTWYELQADKAQEAMAMFGTDEQALFNIFSKLKSNLDWYLLFSAFGVRDGLSLRQYLLSELSYFDKVRLNRIVAKNGLTRKL